MANEQPEVKFNVDPNLYPITEVAIIYDQENFLFLITSGIIRRSFVASPKLSKRIFLLLQGKIEEYENKHGELRTQLPKAGGTSKVQGMGFVSPQQKK